MIIVETQYWPSQRVYARLIDDPHLIIESHDNYQKRSLRNRCYLATSQGIQFLSIPLKKGKNNQLSIRNVEISYDENWRDQHFKFIQTNYGNAPFFHDIFPNIQQIYLSDYSKLFDLNLALIKWSLSFLDWDISITLNDHYDKKFTDHIMDLRNKVGISAHRADTCDNIPEYPQLFESTTGFLPLMSILDLLFCLGPESKEYLRRLNEYLFQSQ